jgi:hypothetical protein
MVLPAMIILHAHAVPRAFRAVRRISRGFAPAEVGRKKSDRSPLTSTYNNI